MIEREKLVSLVEKAQKGDNEALNELISECYNGFYYFALKSTGDEDKAAEVTQDSCMEIISTINNLREPAAFITWSQRIIYHKCIRHQKPRREVQAEEDEDGLTIFDRVADEDVNSMPEEVYENKEFQQTIQDLLNSLPPEQCSSLMLYYYEKLSVKEIAEIQGTSEGTVKSRLNYGRKAVKNKVEEYEKRTGTKLHAILPLPLLIFFLFKKGAEELPVVPAIPAITGGAASAGAAASGAASAGVAASGAAGTGVAALGTSLVTKIVAGVIAAAAVIGTTVGIIAFKNNDGSDTDRPGHTQTDSSDTDTDGQTHEHSYVFTGEKDNNYHTLSCSCGETEEQPHSYENGLCLCGAAKRSSEGLEYELSEDGKSYVVTGIGSCTDTDIIISSTYNELPVTFIGYQAFYDCSSLTSVTIPDSVTVIGYQAFYGCDNLTSVTMGNGVTSIGEEAFHNCSSLTSITIPDSVTGIGEEAFHGCDNITDIVIPGSVTNIEKFAFSGCDNLTSVTICDGVKSIGNGAFEYCKKLTNITIPDSVTSLGNSMFYDCTSLTSVTIGNGVTSIGNQTFAFCESLTNITIPKSVIEIGDYVFNNCKTLTSITYTGTKSQWNWIEMGRNWDNSTGNYTIHCADGKITK